MGPISHLVITARLAERKRVAELLRARGASAVVLANKGRFAVAEGERLKRWLEAAADDVEAGID